MDERVRTPATSAGWSDSLGCQRREHLLRQRCWLVVDVNEEGVAGRLERIELRLQQRRVHVMPLAFLKARSDQLDIPFQVNPAHSLQAPLQTVAVPLLERGAGENRRLASGF